MAVLAGDDKDPRARPESGGRKIGACGLKSDSGRDERADKSGSR
jgi:hypothetical protein